MKTPQQILDQAREEFEKNFVDNSGKEDVEDEYYNVVSNGDKILSWHERTLQSFIEAEMEHINWLFTPHEYESDDPQYEKFAIQLKEKYKNKIISHLKGLLVTL